MLADEGDKAKAEPTKNNTLNLTQRKQSAIWVILIISFLQALSGWDHNCGPSLVRVIHFRRPAQSKYEYATLPAEFVMKLVSVVCIGPGAQRWYRGTQDAFERGKMIDGKENDKLVRKKRE